ncbi:EscU/YscU/HrcU family type III secretion system export apparatus switch protein [Ramlibacter alkalitolerans]|uniref:Flagellar type III secretion system protein FlhB n=1 Tax=Ramlibacter alkalitolerans TaxID=2039631 RepID=A0ABS1JKV3_9BURK|nr:EscU/YscU/HrcU family type III secretion system export apparatus switch protein [Ramlibacter alkalitolerans]MBL0424870.1 flagellar type III secretion system protein FlhB [Ramlibacter alkalitolerans]
MSASEASREDRHLPASEQRLRQAREQGQLPRSRELAHLAAALALIALLAGVGPWLAREALALLAQGLRFDRSAAFEPALLAPRLGTLALHGLLIVAPVAGALALLFVGATLAVGGWNVSLQALQPRFDRLDPLAGLARLFERRHLLDHLRLVLVAAGLLAAAWLYVSRHGAEVARLASMPLVPALQDGFGWLAAGLAMLAAVCFVSALADVPLQIFKHRAELRMTQEEARQEHKEAEGDPHVKGERRRRARELARGRMLADVPKASVVVTNPTHYAVALQYGEGMGAPRIVAMGTDLLALKIREVARAAQVPVLEAPPLARALHRHGEVGGEVPVALYTAVAQVLAWVYRLRDALQPGPEPVIDLPPGLDPQEAGA